ncbi:acyl-CoA dehydrogenase [Parahaliea maris]|uniref:Acyl-CoA dehydrogenase n=1 Tax=Parahaliea maris TaxID=2716870 RepID=A0A5C9A5Z9_9GAMM|nr:acyl-CoA dehydrogenase family protein [Parahaliea maris]TXS96116.1 acyl-CoA dehydrogenase [Parahaliea maris]
MALVLNEEQRLLRDTAREFLTKNAPVAELRRLRDNCDEIGYSPSLWQEMVALGWAGIPVQEAFGGLDFGYLGLGVVLEETGRTLTPSPLFATLVLGASAIQLGGNESQKERLLPAIVAGELTLALALEEHNHHNPTGFSTSLRKENGQYLLNGSKCFVLDGHSADQCLVVARNDSGCTQSADAVCLVLVPRETDGVQCDRTLMADSRNAANLTFQNVVIEDGWIIGEGSEGQTLLEAVLDRGRVALCAEMLGLAREAFERTVDYLKERTQFGVKIGSFQALQHRAAIMLTELELCQSVVLQALTAVDEDSDQLPAMASLAKAKMNELVQTVTNEAVQMHGGIGVTDELDIGLFLKRARVCMQVLGDSGYHKDRYARLCGY